MWQRFTERARSVVFYAQEEAQKYGQGYVSTEHLLLGIVRESDSVGARILSTHGISLNRVRAEVENLIERGEARPSQDMTLNLRAKRVIDLAYEEARHFKQNFIGTEHILLAIIREHDGLAGQVLVKLGLDLETARSVYLSLKPELSVDSAPTPKPPSVTDVSHADRVLQLYAIRKQRMHADQLCLMFLSEASGPVFDTVSACGAKTSVLADLIDQEILARKTPEQLAAGFLSLSELLALASVQAKELGQELNGSHFLLAALAHGNSATSKALEECGVTFEKLRTAISGGS